MGNPLYLLIEEVEKARTLKQVKAVLIKALKKISNDYTEYSDLKDYFYGSRD